MPMFKKFHKKWIQRQHYDALNSQNQELQETIDALKTQIQELRYDKPSERCEESMHCFSCVHGRLITQQKFSQFHGSINTTETYCILMSPCPKFEDCGNM